MPEENMIQNDPVNSNDRVDVLIITPLMKERNAALQQLRDCRKVQKDDFPTYYLATIKTDSESNQGNLVVAVTMPTRMGNTPAAIHTSRFTQYLKPRYVLIVGIAGAVKADLKLGDVVVSDKIIYYEYAKEIPSGSELRVEPESVDPILLDRAMNYDPNWYTLIQAKRPTNSEESEEPRVHFGPIASGEKVIAAENRASELRRLHPKLAAVEMESYGTAAAVAQSQNRPQFIAIRGICDYANEKKDDDWQEYAADSAAAFAVGLLRSGGISVPDNTQPLTRKTLVAIRHQSMEPLPRITTESLLGTLKSANVEEIVIDQTDLYNNDRLTDPVEAARRQRDITSQLSDALNTYPDAEVGYCGIAHIPLLFHMGCQVLTRIPLHLFDHNRHTKQWDLLQSGEDYPQITLKGLPDIVPQEGGDVIVRVSISYPVTSEDIEGIVPDPIASIHLRIDPPKIDVVTSMEQLQQYSIAFRDMLDEIHNKLPNTERVHIFYAGPVPLAVYFGRQISKTIHPRIIVYNHSTKANPHYAWGIEVTADVDSPDFMIRTGD